MNPLELVKLPPLMERSRGHPDVGIGLIDGPVATDHPDLTGSTIRLVSSQLSGRCSLAHSTACLHGTFIAGILSAKRGSGAPAICPDCTLWVRPVFGETTPVNGQLPSTTPDELAAAMMDCIEAGARILNLSVALSRPSLTNHSALENALNLALKRGVIVVAAAGNQGTLGSSAITRHPWVIPVVAYDEHGRLVGQSNLGHTIGRRGLGAPGVGVTSLSTMRDPLSLSGTSVATPFVSGAVALLWSAFPRASAAEVKYAVTNAQAAQRRSVVPPLLDVWAAYQVMQQGGRR